MNRLIPLILLACMPFLSIAQSKLQTPKEFLGYELGDRFTRHHEMVSYYRHVAEVVPHFQFIEYGKTNEHRPLIALVISSKENMDDSIFKKLMTVGGMGHSSHKTSKGMLLSKLRGIEIVTP